MEEFFDTENSQLKELLRKHFDGKIVRKDLTKKIKEGANVPHIKKLIKIKEMSEDEYRRY